MTEPTAGTRRPAVWGWWLGVVLTAAAVAIDVVDGQPLKLATSGLLLAGCLVAALTARRPSRGASTAVALCIGFAIVLMLVRMVGPGL